MPTINLATKLVNFDGVIMKDETGKEITAKIMSCIALNYTTQEKQTWEKKFKLGEIMRLIYNATDSVVIKTEDAALIKEQLGSCPVSNPWIVSQMDTILEGTPDAKSES